MNDLDDLVFNPKTGLFESGKDPTAHLTAYEFRSGRILKNKSDPQRALMKPRINFFRRSGDEHPIIGEQIFLAWNVEQARCVSITFPDGKTVSFPTIGNCQFILPGEECRVKLVAINGKYHTQLTMKIKPRSRMAAFLHRIFRNKNL